uniref:Uncharacterized protein n=1 Tax=Meloidogyne hapla TaxID=6305 RepID=A0A1I8BPF5_MELHA
MLTIIFILLFLIVNISFSTITESEYSKETNSSSFSNNNEIENNKKNIKENLINISDKRKFTENKQEIPKNENFSETSTNNQVNELDKIQKYLFPNDEYKWKHVNPKIQENIIKYYKNNNNDFKQAINNYLKIKNSKNNKINRLELINKIENEVNS